MYKLLSIIVFLAATLAHAGEDLETIIKRLQIHHNNNNATTLAQDGADLETIIKRLQNQELQSSSLVPSEVNNNNVSLSLTAADNVESETSKCVLPLYPEHGSYSLVGRAGARPGLALDAALLTVTCDPPYRPEGPAAVHCYNGQWNTPVPQCKLFCKLTPLTSVTYYCKLTDPNILSGYRKCNDFEPSGTEVHPRCNDFYSHNGVLSYMYCIDGFWDNVATCEPECGTLTPNGEPLVINGVTAKRGELPWHAGIYDKRYTPFMQICGGSLVSTTVIISAAHCFWNDVERVLPAKYFAVGVGKVYRSWNIKEGGQKSDVKYINVPPRFLGAGTNFQDDIAVVILVTPVVLANYVKPACIDFNEFFDEKQLQPGNVGKVAGWGLTAPDGNASSVLKVTELPYVDVKQCIDDLPFVFHSFITSDKICAGTKTGSALCKGDSGGGLVFPEVERGVQRWYLRGLVSTAPRNDHKCNAVSYTSFTKLIKHDDFVRKYLNNRVLFAESLSSSAADNVESETSTTKFIPPANDYSQNTPIVAGCAALEGDRTAAKTGRKAWDKCINYQHELVFPCEQTVLSGSMGRTNHCNHNVDELLVGGRTNAKRNEFPHMVLLGYEESNGTAVWLCGGTLLSDRFILTAGHCTSARDFGPVAYARTGILKRTDDVSATQMHRIRRIIRNPQYKPPTKYHDIALLEVEDPIKLDYTTVPACLDVFGGDHSKATATAWGARMESQADNLKKVTLNKFKQEECQAKFHPSRFLRNGIDPVTQVCYGTEAADTCQGDSGCPITVRNRQIYCMYTVVGVTSLGKSCGNVGDLVVYTKVSNYVDWIESIVFA